MNEWRDMLLDVTFDKIIIPTSDVLFLARMINENFFYR